MSTIKLGDKAKDTITGLTGTVISRHEYLNGCIRLTLQPAELKDGKPVEASYFDIEQLVLVEAAAQSEQKPTGGPHDAPKRPSPPAR
jgi:hypothetical protein